MGFPGWRLGRQATAAVVILTCAAKLAAAQEPFPGQTFTYSQTPADVVALTAERTNRPSNRTDSAIVVKGSPAFNLSDPSYIFFSTGNDCQNTDIYPIIAVFDGDRWNTISFPGATNHFWSQVYPSFPDGDRMYAVSRTRCESNGRLFLYRSDDYGRSWQVTLIPMHYLSRFLSLRVEPDGTGEIIVQSDDDADPAGGHHVYRTSDWGATWSEPVFSETILSPPARPGDFVTPEMIVDMVRSGNLPTFDYVPIQTIMDSIENEYAMYRGRQQ